MYILYAKNDDVKVLAAGIGSVYFDGRKDKVSHEEKIRDRLRKRTIN